VTVIRFALLLGLVLGLAGCSSSKAGDAAGVAPDDPTPAAYPQPFEVSLYATSKQGRHVYYEVGTDGVLSFGGGRHAHIRAADPVARLTNAERNELWRVIEQHELLGAKSEMFPKAEQVRYDVTIRAGGKRHRFNAVDEKVAGVAELDALLGRFKTELSSNRLYQAVDEKIRRSGGAVEKQ
jgi:hypothetical protein